MLSCICDAIHGLIISDVNGMLSIQEAEFMRPLIQSKMLAFTFTIVFKAVETKS